MEKKTKTNQTTTTKLKKKLKKIQTKHNFNKKIGTWIDKKWILHRSSMPAKHIKRVPIIIVWIYGSLCVVKNSLLASRKTYSRCRIRIWELNQNGRKVWLNEQHLFIWYPDENLLYLYKSFLLRSRTRFHLVSVNKIDAISNLILNDKILHIESRHSVVLF